MGLVPHAELIWGIPVSRYDAPEEDTPSIWWDEDADDWRELEGELEIVTWGHYEDPDGPRGILTSSRVDPLRADAWDASEVSPRDLATPLNHDKVYSKSQDQLRASMDDPPVNFYADAGWWLVASYG
jgi:hypothetical protein